MCAERQQNDLVEVDLQGARLGCNETHEEVARDVDQSCSLLHGYACYTPLGPCKS